jgi:arsenate reductase
MNIYLFGIKNCDNVKKAEFWLEKNNITYQFIDLKQVKTENLNIMLWLEKFSWDKLINKKSKTWKSLSNKVKLSVIDNQSARKLIYEFPLVIKRPIIEYGDKLIIGFSEKNYENIFE